MSGHSIVWTLDSGGYVRGAAVCTEPVGANCRLGPQSHNECFCESWNTLRDDDSAPYHYADGGGRAIGDRHYMTDTGECHVCAFLNDDQSLLPELCVEDVGDFEIGRTAIEPVWNGEGCDWKRAAS